MGFDNKPSPNATPVPHLENDKLLFGETGVARDDDPPMLGDQAVVPVDPGTRVITEADNDAYVVRLDAIFDPTKYSLHGFPTLTAEDRPFVDAFAAMAADAGFSQGQFEAMARLAISRDWPSQSSFLNEAAKLADHEGWSVAEMDKGMQIARQLFASGGSAPPKSEVSKRIAEIEKIMRDDYPLYIRQYSTEYSNLVRRRGY